MHQFSFSHLDKAALRRELSAANGNERVAIATLIALIAEYDAQRFYLEDAYESMFAFCVQELHLSEQGALKRIRVARAARQCPAVLAALAENRVHLGGMTLLAPHLTPDSAEDLLAAATHKTCAEIQQLLAARFPRPDLPARVQDLASPPALPVSPESDEPGVAMQPQLSTWRVEQAARPQVAPLSSQRYGVQLSVGQRAYDKLRYVQSLLGHRVPAEELEAVFESGLDAYMERLERQKFAKTSRPRLQRGSTDPDYIPLEVKRVVWERDGGRCTFVGGNGRRCTACTDLNLDHIIPRARGGNSTVDNLRLLCRAHNQYEAERIFGAGFMEMKREAARAAAAERRTAAEDKRAQAEAARAEKRARAEAERARVEAKRVAEAERAAIEEDPDRSVVRWLRHLGIRIADARRAASHCDSIPDASLEERIKAALRFLGAGRGRRVGTAVAAATYSAPSSTSRQFS